MSFKTREKKRRSRQKARAIQQNRRQHPERWYLTIVKRNASCNDCGGALREGKDFVYRHSPMTVLCRVCAEKRKIAPRPSALYEEKRTKPAQKKRANRSRRARQRGREGR